jgi:hypothetical protein
MTKDAPTWFRLQPAVRSDASRDELAALAQQLSRLTRRESAAHDLEMARVAFSERARASRRVDRQAVLASGLLFFDLAAQGWGFRRRANCAEVSPPQPVAGDQIAEKSRVRRQELVKRDAQLQKDSVKAFLRTIERKRIFDGRFVSIFSLMRDGRALAVALQEARQHINNGWADALAQICDPYIQFVSSEHTTCEFTGLRVMDIWRYFRHTWTNQYNSVPGRTMLFLVRDRAAPLHPVMGIGALSSPVMQIRERDMWIGWHPDSFLEHVKRQPTDRLARWIVKTLDTAVEEIYVADFLEEGLLSAATLKAPSDAIITTLMRDSIHQRQLHHRYAKSTALKQSATAKSNDDWIQRAKTHLFRSKRALALASYLRARVALQGSLGRKPTAKNLARLTATGIGCDAIRTILKKAKADRVGISVADITVCGAVQPYNAILGGKLVAMLSASPEVITEYRRRYSKSASEIASAMAGRPITRTPHLALLGTTSLYGIGSSQYNRIRIPCHRLGGDPSEVLRYEELGRSQAFGTSQYSEETVQALTDLVQQTADGKRVNSIFGEGVSPKLRKVRHALETLELPSDLLLRHHRPRIVYGVSLVGNLRSYLLGLDRKPEYLLSLADPSKTTAEIAAWWRERWLRNRILSDDVLGQVSQHTLVIPISHGARVKIPASARELTLFPDFL